ncbi:hypothetical protein N7463_008982 [Penicillium fimorum]|uniref:Kinesin light chain n=1 Tax=Penicillium fimorum TaxID=1882269 RepID=A0A9W9XQR8_9EURO|nr:hypothetical protein N7463_008982 [Penicillium fimorum]
MHRLVQLTTRVWLKTNRQIEQWKGKFISTLCDKFPTGHFSPMSNPQCHSSQHRLDIFNNWATLLYNGAWYAWQSGNIADTGEMASKSRDQRVMLLGDDHKDVLDSMDMLAAAYLLEGQWEEAEELQIQVIKTCKTKLGEDHPSTLASMTNLASTYRQQGRWKEAEELEV